MNPTPSQPERPEPPEGYRLLESYANRLPAGALVYSPSGVWKPAERVGKYPNRLCIYATRTPAPEAVAGEQYEDLGDLSATPPWHSRRMSCDKCRVTWLGCWDNFQCPKCGEGELPTNDPLALSAPTPPVEADKDVEIARLWDIAAHLGRNDLHESADFLRNLATGLPLAYADLTTAREEIARLREEFQKAKEWNRLTELEIANLRSLYEEQEKELNLAKQEALAIRHSVVSTVGGVDYEGNPTSVINYLQRLRILVAAESDLTTARATIAERDKRIETLVGALEEMVRNGRKQGWNDNYPSSMKRADAALDHAAEGKEQV